MDFELSDEQQFLREAARGALSRHETVEAAREALDGGERLDLWDVGRGARWPRPVGSWPASAFWATSRPPRSSIPPRASTTICSAPWPRARSAPRSSARS